MKNVYKITLAFLVLITSACSDFLTEELEGSYSSETFWKTESHATLALTGVYKIASFNSTNNAMWVFGDVASDDAIRGANPGDFMDAQSIDDFNYTRSNSYLDIIWAHYYEGISRANYLLYYGANIDMDASRKAEILSEARFLRAYFYFHLVNIFGEIPIKTTPPLNEEEIYKGKSSVEDVYAQIESDLLAAKNALPATRSGSGIGRATKGAVWGLLAKTYLYQAKWTEALEAADSVIDQGIYSLQPVYKNNFIDSTQNNSESVFEVQHINGGLGLGSYMSQYFTPFDLAGYGANLPTEDFVNEFESATDPAIRDPRLEYTVVMPGEPWINGEAYDPLWSVTGYVQKKHAQPLTVGPVNSDGALNYVFMRYAEVLLIRAEALNELNRTAEALVPLNEVRKRARESYLYDEDLPGFGVVPAGLLTDVVSADQNVVRAAIQHERRVELGFEFSRFFDLMRYGATVAEAALEYTNFEFDQHRYFLIPQSELDTNPKIDN
jgi:starch-binding outer membrane protein, SusD/RagB family